MAKGPLFRMTAITRQGSFGHLLQATTNELRVSRGGRGDTTALNPLSLSSLAGSTALKHVRSAEVAQLPSTITSMWSHADDRANTVHE